jgi:feruloyl esterase
MTDVTVVSAQLVAAGAFTPSAQPGAATPPAFAQMPEFCRVVGRIRPTGDSDIRFEVWLPAAGWNGKFMGVGNGGASGAIVHNAMAAPLERGYAVASTDTGHEGGAPDYSFALGHPEKLTDNAWRAVHLMTVNAKTVIEAYYTAEPRLSYWNACSTGGRQGLKEAQRFPADYDGIIAGAPANNFQALSSYSLLVQRTVTDPNGLPPAKLAILKAEALRQCEFEDGVGDNVIQNPMACRFDPAVIQCAGADAPTCLTAPQVAAARTLHAGIVDAEGRTVFPGTSPGSEPAWAALGGPFKIGESWFRNVVFANDPTWTPARHDLLADLARARQLDAGSMDATDPDLSAFFARGGKLILYHGWTDGLIPARNTINYYESVAQRVGARRMAQSVRLFMVPGMDHCAGGEGVNLPREGLAPELEAWVERGVAPERVLASRRLTPDSRRMRPLCAWPKVATYNGAGVADDAENWSCVAP